MIEPVMIEVAEVLSNGLMTILFSEKLKTYLELTKGFNQRLLSEDFIDVEFINNNDGSCSKLKPRLENWYISEFDYRQMKIFLNFTNPVHVSSEYKDEIRVTVKN